MTSRLYWCLMKLELARGSGWREWRDLSMDRWPTDALEGYLAECLKLEGASMVRDVPYQEGWRLTEEALSEHHYEPTVRLVGTPRPWRRCASAPL